MSRKFTPTTIIIPEYEVEPVSESCMQLHDKSYPTLTPIRKVKLISDLSDDLILPYFTPITFLVNNIVLQSNEIFQIFAITVSNINLQTYLQNHIRKINKNILREKSKELHIYYFKKIIYALVYSNIHTITTQPPPPLPNVVIIPQQVMEIYSEVNYKDDEKKRSIEKKLVNYIYYYHRRMFAKKVRIIPFEGTLETAIDNTI